MEDHCLRAMKIVHHYANDTFYCLISEHQIVNTLREPIFILSGKYKRFTFVHPVSLIYKEIVTETVVVISMTAVTCIVLFRSESKSAVSTSVNVLKMLLLQLDLFILTQGKFCYWKNHLILEY